MAHPLASESSRLLFLALGAVGVCMVSSPALAGEPPRLEPVEVDRPWGSPDPASVTPEAAGGGTMSASQAPTATAAGDGTGAGDGAGDEAGPGPGRETPPEARAKVPAPEAEIEGDPNHPFALEGELGKKKRAGRLTAYGMVVVNAAFNSGTPFPSQEAPIGAVKNSRNGAGLPSDGAFVITARQSRLGFDAALEINDRVDVAGKIEADFFGLHEDVGPGGVPQTGIRLRLAYLDVGGPRWRFIAGQNWSVVTPRLPTSLGHMVIALHTFSGAIWNRLPQLAGVFRQPLRASTALGETAVVVQLAAARSVSHDGFGAAGCPPETANPDGSGIPTPSPAPSCRITRFDDPDQGALAGFPVGQARVAFESERLEVGVAGHAGAEKWWASRLQGGELAVDPQLVPTWLVSGDLRIAPRWFWINAQGYYGVNLNGMFSRHGVRADPWVVADGDPRAGEARGFTALPSFGGWLEIGAPLGTEKLKLVTSAGADVGDRDGRLLGETAEVGGRAPGVPDGAPWANFGIFGGLIYAPHPNFDMSAEYYRSTTVFKRWVADDAGIRNDWGFNDHISANFRLKF